MQSLGEQYPKLDAHVMHFVDRMVNWAGMQRCEMEQILDTLCDMSGFLSAFMAAGETWEIKAKDAVRLGHERTARQRYHEAFGCYRIADFYFSKDGSGRLDAYDASVRCFGLAAGDPAHDLKFVSVKLDGVELPGYVVVPHSASRPCPGVVIIYGADGNKEEHYWGSVMPAVERGMAVIIVDGPGQGVSLRRNHVHVRHDMEKFGTACLQVLLDDPRVDSNRIGIMGSSFGGYSGPRAFAFEPRFKACLAITGLYDVIEGVWDTYTPIHPQLTYNIGAKSPAEAKELYRKFTLKGLLEKLDRPIAIHHGAADRLVPTSQAETMYALIGGPKVLKIWPGGSHNVLNLGFEPHAEMWDWMRDTLTR